MLNLCGETEKATIYYEELLNELPKQHALIPQINKQLLKASKAKPGKVIASFSFSNNGILSMLNMKFLYFSVSDQHSICSDQFITTFNGICLSYVGHTLFIDIEYYNHL